MDNVTFSDDNKMLLAGILVLLAFVVFVTVMMVIAVLQFAFILQNKMKQLQGITETEERTFWQKIAGLHALSKEKDLELDEDFDGIRELDNPVPVWFNLLFYGTIGFAVIYLGLYQVWKVADLQAAEYEAEVALAVVQKEAYLKKVAANLNENNVAMPDQAGIANGKKIFESQCAACHGKLGEGKIGPNLTDNFWIHGGTLTDIFKTIKYGVTEKGMISWEKKLNPIQIQEVSGYILSLKGTNPPNAKEAQGVEVN
jgi:cytochrome c oxidase cbb3-type subunit 3